MHSTCLHGKSGREKAGLSPFNSTCTHGDYHLTGLAELVALMYVFGVLRAMVFL